MRLRLVTSLAAVWSLAAGPASAVEFRALSSWDQSYVPRAALFEQFLKNVETASKGDMKFNLSGPETVPPFEQLQPTGSNVFQFLFSHGAYHFGTTPYLIAVEGLSGDLAKWRQAGIKDQVDKHYQRFGLKLIMLPQVPEGSAYNIILRAPIGPSGDLQGRKIRATQSYAGILSMLGASPVNLPPAEIYTSLEKGVVDGAGWPVIGPLGYRWYEVAKYIMRPSFGVVIHSVFMNLNAWNGLSDAQRKLLDAEAIKMEDAWYVEWGKIAGAEQEALVGKGAQLTEIGPAQKAKLADAWTTGVLDFTMPRNPKDIGELREFAKSKGLLR
jgi:TRAP-type mannitol/chloroaromatic compound transport system substrate-binding protein